LYPKKSPLRHLPGGLIGVLRLLQNAAGNGKLQLA